MPTDPQRLQCMEIWGGNDLVNTSMSLGGLDAWVEARPHANAPSGGDVYYVSSCATGRITRLLLADVSGHGSGVAEVARSLRTLMREHVNHLDQCKFVMRMNESFTHQSRNGMFATAVVCTFFGPTGDLTLCNAGHPPPLLYRAEERSWRLLECDVDVETTDLGAPDNLPLGIFDTASYAQFRVTLAPGDRVLCYTDSLIEACDLTTDEQLGPRGLLEVINTLPDVPTQQLIPALADALRRRVGATLDNDDVTLLLFTPNPATAHASFATRALAPVRFVHRMISWRGEGLRRIPLPDLSVANMGGAILPSLNRAWRRGR